MALAAICPHCHTMFRVASDQLKLRGGIVRCGACHEVFDGNAALVDLDAIPVQEPQADPQDSALDAAGVDRAGIDDTAAPAATPAGEAGQAAADDDGAFGALPVLSSVVQDPRDADETIGGPPAAGEVDPAAALQASDDDSLARATPAGSEVADVPAGSIEYTLDFDTTLSSHAAPRADQTAPQNGAGESAMDAPALTALPPPDTSDGDDGHDGDDGDSGIQSGALPAPASPPRPPAAVDSLAPLLMRASAAAEDRPGPATVLPAGQQAQVRARRARAAAERKQAPPVTPQPPSAAPLATTAAVPPDDEPEFVRRGRQREESGERTRTLMIGACVVLALALLVQGVWSFRNTLAARYPGARPLLGGLCAVMGCKVELPTQIDALAVETGELQTLDASTFSLVTLLRNQGDLVQAWPHLELALTDANDKTLVRRVFTPADYLPPGAMASRGFAARSEQAVKLTFQLDQIKASGYHLAIFYP